jgi:hypothetical protein
LHQEDLICQQGDQERLARQHFIFVCALPKAPLAASSLLLEKPAVLEIAPGSLFVLGNQVARVLLKCVACMYLSIHAII